MLTPFNDEIDAQNKKIEALIAEITAAFDGVSREDGMTMHEAAEWDRQCQPGPWIEIERAKDTETRWQDVPDELIGDNSVGSYVLNYVDAKGFRYYIPAFMIWALKAKMGIVDDSQSNTDVISNLMPDSLTYRFSLLNAEQSKVIAHFMEFLAEQDQDWFEARVEARQKALQLYEELSIDDSANT